MGMNSLNESTSDKLCLISVIVKINFVSMAFIQGLLIWNRISKNFKLIKEDIELKKMVCKKITFDFLLTR